VLGVPSVSVQADFFDAGGNSLHSVALLARIEKEMGRKVSLTTFFQVPTIEALAAYLREDKWIPPEEQVFPMRAGGAKPSLLLVDAGPFHRPLVRRLSSARAVLGVALPQLSALPKDFTLEDIAANLVQALEKAGIEEPYYLAGWSQAGVIAYEMAQQLRARGKEVALLILFDTNNPDYLRSFQAWLRYPLRLYFWLEKVFHHGKKMRGLPWRKAWRLFRERMHRFQLERIERRQRPGTRGEASSEEDLLEPWKVQYLAAGDYKPQLCDWPMVLVRSEVLQSGWFRDPQLGWGNLARRGLQVVAMPGEHDSMFLEPDVQRLAAALNDCLQRPNSAERLARSTCRSQVRDMCETETAHDPTVPEHSVPMTVS
jgi:thioesterase domain-containing protein/acyl carrier protein